MNGFYLGTSIFGIALIILSIVLIMLDKKKAVDYATRIEDEKNNLLKVIADSEEMLEELNRFSDYVINQVEKRSSQLGTMLNEFDEHMVKMEESVKSADRKIYNDTTDTAIKTSARPKEHSSKKANYSSSKHQEVIELVEKGMSDTEIAKALNMGKGEVQLILGMNIHKIKTDF